MDFRGIQYTAGGTDAPNISGIIGSHFIVPEGRDGVVALPIVKLNPKQGITKTKAIKWSLLEDDYITSMLVKYPELRKRNASGRKSRENLWSDILRGNPVVFGCDKTAEQIRSRALELIPLAIGRWLPEDIETLIRHFKENPFLWDSSHTSYRDGALRHSSLETLTRKLGYRKSVDDILSKFRNLRTAFVQRAKNKKSLKNSYGKPWAFYDGLSFLSKCSSSSGKSTKINSEEVDATQFLPPCNNVESGKDLSSVRLEESPSFYQLLTPTCDLESSQSPPKIENCSTAAVTATVSSRVNYFKRKRTSRRTDLPIDLSRRKKKKKKDNEHKKKKETSEREPFRERHAATNTSPASDQNGRPDALQSFCTNVIEILRKFTETNQEFVKAQIQSVLAVCLEKQSNGEKITAP